MAIYVTGDLHGTDGYGRVRFSTRKWPLGKDLTRDDTVIVCGDFGYVWDGSNTDTYWLDWLESKPWTTCFCDGNHENHALLAQMATREWHGGLVGEVRPHVLHLKRGEIFEIEGKRIFVMGGARSHDIEWREEGVSWWPEEMPSEAEIAHAREGLDRVDWKVDYIISHDAPVSLADELCFECNRDFDPNDRLQNFLEEVNQKASFTTWFFGHYHDDEWRDAKHRLMYFNIVPIETLASDEPDKHAISWKEA